MYVAIIDGVIHYSTQHKDGYQELKGTTLIPYPLEEELRNQITALQEQASISDEALQELILTTIGDAK